MAHDQQKLISPLRYPGSKRRLAGQIDRIIRSTKRIPDLFVEPFAGGASVSLHLLHVQGVKTIGLMDADPLVASFWKTAFFDSHWLCEQIRTVPVTLKQWEAYRGMKPRSDRTRALMCLFLNRTSFSGILHQRAGPLGGYSQTSDYRIDCRFPRATLIERIQALAHHKAKVAFVWNINWKQGLERIRGMQQRKRLSKKIFYYFDPPFFSKAENLYTHYFTDEDHKELCSSLRRMRSSLQNPWLLSYDDADRAVKLYGNGSRSRSVEIVYSMSAGGDRRITREALLSNLPIIPNLRRVVRNQNGTQRNSARMARLNGK